jgi:hypothetical protein
MLTVSLYPLESNPMPSNDMINVDVFDAKTGESLEEIKARDGTIYIAIEVGQQFRVSSLILFLRPLDYLGTI